jgi:tight adherence protein B
VKLTLIAVTVAALTWIVFMLLDQKNKKSKEVEEVVEAPKEKRPKATGGVIDYSVYHLSKQEKVGSIIAGAILFFALGYIFYMNIIVAVVLAGLGLLFPKIRTKSLLVKRKKELAGQFKQALFSISSALSSGKSVENAFQDVVKDLSLLYPDPDTYIIREFELINRRVQNGETIEFALRDFGERSDLEDIQNFADVFLTCKRYGGDLVEVIRRTTSIIADKLEIEQDISILIANKKFEAKILLLAPVGMILMMNLSSGDYMEPLYQFPGAGPVIMTAALAILGFVYWLLQKIMEIKV